LPWRRYKNKITKEKEKEGHARKAGVHPGEVKEGGKGGKTQGYKKVKLVKRDAESHGEPRWRLEKS